jgi:hypothetical protein
MLAMAETPSARVLCAEPPIAARTESGQLGYLTVTALAFCSLAAARRAGDGSQDSIIDGCRKFGARPA